jgi:HAD superfamily hydrolase (TIGR01509 family)
MPLEVSRISTIFFDVDGTLSDTDDQFVENLKTWLYPVRFLLPQNNAKRFARRLVMATESPGNYLYGIFDRIGIDGMLGDIGDIMYRFGLGKKDEPFKLVPGVKEMLLSLQGDYLMGIVSARGQRSTQLFLNQFDIASLFDCVVTAHTCRHTKPWPDPILYAAERLGAPVENCLMVGDTKVDIRAGKDAGAQTIGVLCGFGEEEELLQAGADLILPSTEKIIDILL